MRLLKMQGYQDNSKSLLYRSVAITTIVVHVIVYIAGVIEEDASLHHGHGVIKHGFEVSKPDGIWNDLE